MEQPEPAWRRKTQPCPFYAKGRCLFSERCNFLHEQPTTTTNTQTLPHDLSNTSIVQPGLRPKHSPRRNSLLLALGLTFDGNDDDGKKDGEEDDEDEGFDASDEPHPLSRGASPAAVLFEESASVVHEMSAFLDSYRSSSSSLTYDSDEDLRAPGAHENDNDTIDAAFPPIPARRTPSRSPPPPADLLSPVEMSPAPLRTLSYSPAPLAREDSVDSGYADSWIGPVPMRKTPPPGLAMPPTPDIFVPPFGKHSSTPPRSPGLAPASTLDLLASPFGSPSRHFTKDGGGSDYFSPTRQAFSSSDTAVPTKRYSDVNSVFSDEDDEDGNAEEDNAASPVSPDEDREDLKEIAPLASSSASPDSVDVSSSSLRYGSLSATLANRAPERTVSQLTISAETDLTGVLSNVGTVSPPDEDEDQSDDEGGDENPTRSTSISANEDVTRRTSVSLFVHSPSNADIDDEYSSDEDDTRAAALSNGWDATGSFGEPTVRQASFLTDGDGDSIDQEEDSMGQEGDTVDQFYSAYEEEESGDVDAEFVTSNTSFSLDEDDGEEEEEGVSFGRREEDESFTLQGAEDSFASSTGTDTDVDPDASFTLNDANANRVSQEPTSDESFISSSSSSSGGLEDTFLINRRIDSSSLLPYDNDGTDNHSSEHGHDNESGNDNAPSSPGLFSPDPDPFRALDSAPTAHSSPPSRPRTPRPGSRSPLDSRSTRPVNAEPDPDMPSFAALVDALPSPPPLPTTVPGPRVFTPPPPFPPPGLGAGAGSGTTVSRGRAGTIVPSRAEAFTSSTARPASRTGSTSVAASAIIPESCTSELPPKVDPTALSALMGTPRPSSASTFTPTASSTPSSPRQVHEGPPRGRTPVLRPYSSTDKGKQVLRTPARDESMSSSASTSKKVPFGWRASVPAQVPHSAPASRSTSRRTPSLSTSVASSIEASPRSAPVAHGWHFSPSPSPSPTSEEFGRRRSGLRPLRLSTLLDPPRSASLSTSAFTNIPTSISGSAHIPSASGSSHIPSTSLSSSSLSSLSNCSRRVSLSRTFGHEHGHEHMHIPIYDSDADPSHGHRTNSSVSTSTSGHSLSDNPLLTVRQSLKDIPAHRRMEGEEGEGGDTADVSPLELEEEGREGYPFPEEDGEETLQNPGVSGHHRLVSQGSLDEEKTLQNPAATGHFRSASYGSTDEEETLQSQSVHQRTLSQAFVDEETLQDPGAASSSVSRLSDVSEMGDDRFDAHTQYVSPEQQTPARSRSSTLRSPTFSTRSPTLSISVRSPASSLGVRSPLSASSQRSPLPEPTLMFAIASDSPDAVRRVLEHGGADPNEQCGPQSALAFALTSENLRNRLEIVKILLAHGADASALSDPERNPPRSASSLSFNADEDVREESSGPLEELELDRATRYYVERADVGAKALGRTAFRPLGRVRYDIVGQDRALEQLFRVLGMHARGMSKAPAVVLLCGPSGHGKSLLARKFGALLDVPTHTVNMTAIRSTHDLWKAYSMSPYEEPTDETLAEFIRANEGKRCVVVLDEIEKAQDEKSLYSLLMPWELGRCSLDAGERHIDVRNVIWIGTSNVGQDVVFDFHAERPAPDALMSREAYKDLTDRVRPRVSERLGSSLVSRVTAVLPFVPFSAEERLAIASEALATAGADMEGTRDHDVAEALVAQAAASYVPEEGARSLYRAVAGLLMDAL